MASGFGKPVGYQMLVANHLQSPTLLLKDFLRDDISSCSSSGFKSLPRRQCFLQPHFCSSSSSTKSALQKASESVLNAIKSLPFPARQRAPSFSRTQRCKAKKGGLLSRSLSRRLLNRSFWRRPSSSKGDEATFASSTNSSASNSNINKWTESHFTCSLTAAKDFTEMDESVTPANTFSTTNSAKDLSNEEKEQFSPVSVLDCPLFHEEEEITSPFNSTTSSRVEGTKHKHMKKGQHFKGVASLKPVALEKRMSWSVMQEDEPIYKHPTKPCRVLVPIMCTQNVQVGEERDVCITETGKYSESSWRICDEEIQHLVMELEVDFSTSLVEELVLDLTT